MSYTPQIIELADGLKCVLLEDYKKLEQERDEARRELENMKQTKRELMQMVYGRNFVEQDLLKQNAKLRAELVDTKRERDEAREALMKIEDLFIDGTDIYADRETMGTIARAALEGAK